MAKVEKPACLTCNFYRPLSICFDGECQKSDSQHEYVKHDEYCEHHQDWKAYAESQRSGRSEFERRFPEVQ